jgi:hypothetical protein
MSDIKTPIIFASLDRIWLMGENPAYGWNEGNIEEILVEIKSKLAGKSVRILIDDSVSFLVNVPVEKDNISPGEVLGLIQSLVPEKIENGYWDYKINKHTGINHIQAFVIKKTFLEPFTQGLLASDLSVEASEPVSLSLSRLTSFEDSPHVIVYSLGDEGYSLILADQGEVLVSVYVEKLVSKDQIEKFLQLCEGEYHIVPSKIIISPDYFVGEHEIKGVPIAHVELDPFRGIAKKDDIKAPDENSLNLNSQKLLKPLVLPEAPQGEELPKKRKKRLGFVGLMLSVAALAFVAYILFLQPKESVPTPSPTPQVLPTPAPVDLTTYKIQILNGTGVEGEAGNVKGLLAIDSAETGNASSFEYEFTEVSLKEGVPEEVYTEIEKKLSGVYNVSKSAQVLTSDEDFDVVIITGVKK